MRKPIVLLSFFAIFTCCWSAPISPQQAFVIAQQFADEHLSCKQLVAESRPANRLKVHEDQTAAYYVFPMEGNNGFVIVSGDDRTYPILGYSETGDLSRNDLPDNLRWWLDYYEEVITQLPKEETSTAMKSESDSGRPTDVIQPLIQTFWNQDYPYNLYCPTSQGVTCPTGCVATALAQIMYYHQYPVDACKEIPGYYCHDLDLELPPLSPITFDWDKMKKYYGYNDSKESQEAVARLMQYCGQMLRMSYSPGGSGSHPVLAEYYLPEYFGYPKTIHTVYRAPYSISEWDELILNELRNNRPVLYSGYTTDFAGHAFVCDGYNGNGLYHINWGWGGVADGYYRISVLDANGTGTGGSTTENRFSVNQLILIGIQSEGTDDFTDMEDKLTASSRPCLMNGSHFTRASSEEDFKSVQMAMDFYYHDSDANWQSEFYCGYGLFDGSGELLKVLHSSKQTIWNNSAQPLYSSKMNFGKDITSGVYTIRPIYKKSGVWVPARHSDKNYVCAEIGELEMTLTPVPKADFQVSDVRKIGKSFVFKLYNPSEEFNGYIYLRKSDNEGNMYDVGFEEVAIEPQSQREFSMYLSGESVNLDNDIFYLSVDDYCENYFYSNVFNDGALINTTVSIQNIEEENNTVYGDRVMCRISLQNEGEGSYHHFLNVSLVDENGLERMPRYHKVIDVDSESSATYDVELPISDYTYTYQLKVSVFDSSLQESVSMTPSFSVAKGAIYWTAAGEMKTQPAAPIFVVPEDAVAINLRNAYSSNVKANSNPNTIYFLDKSVPKGLSGKNIVNYENQGGSITLTDGYDYYIPVEITATNNIHFIATYADDEVNKWSTICLPFAPTNVTADGVSIDWFKQVSDESKRFWLMSFKGVEGDNARFEFAQQFDANTPYLFAIDHSMKGKTIDFKANKTVLNPTASVSSAVRADGYCFVGASSSQPLTFCYKLDNDRFILQGDVLPTLPFKAYLTGESALSQEILYLNAADITDGIHLPSLAVKETPQAIYNLAGQCVGTLRDAASLPKGLYIVNGRKWVKE